MRKPFNGNYPVTQKFGANPNIYGPGGHRGIDYGLPGSTPVIAVMSGTVKKMPFQTGGFGNYLTLTSGVYTCYYGHLKSITKTGAVKEGDVIGYSNNTGWSTGNHLHFEVYKGRTLLNPNNFLNPPKPAPVLKRVTVIVPAGANIRQEPTTKAKVMQRVPYGTRLWASARVKGQVVNGNPYWYRIPGRGYVSLTVAH